MIDWKWALVVALPIGLIGCGHNLASKPPAMQGPEPGSLSLQQVPLHVMRVLPMSVEEHVQNSIERKIAFDYGDSTDFYPKVNSLKTKPTPTKGLYEFEATVSVYKRPGRDRFRLVGTYDLPSSSLTITRRQPL